MATVTYVNLLSTPYRVPYPFDCLVIGHGSATITNIDPDLIDGNPDIQNLITLGRGAISIPSNVTPISADYQALQSDETIVTDASSNTIQITMPLPEDGHKLTIKDSGTASSHTVTIVPYGTETFDGNAQVEFTDDFAGNTFMGFHGNWLILS